MSTTFKRFRIFSALAILMSLAMFFNACEEPGGGTDPCQTVNCINGDCLVSATGDPFCNCDPGFSGPTCEDVDDPCTALPCPVNSSCIVENGEAFCECDFGYEGTECEIEIRSKFLGTYTGQVNYVDGDVFTNFTENLTATAHPDSIEQFYISNFEDLSIPPNERFSLLCKTEPQDQDANHFRIIGTYTVDYILDGVQYRVRYSGTGLGTKNFDTGNLVIEYKVEDLDPANDTVLATLTNILTLTPQ